MSKEDQGGFHQMVNCDIYSEIGKVSSSLAMIKESDTVVDENIGAVALDTSGNSYWCSADSGKIWKRDTGGNWTLPHTNSEGAMSGALYYNGYIYYASYSSLGRYNLAATWDDTWKTFTNGSANHPMGEQNLTLFVGDGKYVASVNSSATFSGNALDLPPQQRIKTVNAYENDLILGTQVGSNVNQCGVFRWDTYSDSWTVEDYVRENGVFCAIPGDNTLYYQIGRDGNIYEYNGVKLMFSFKLRDGENSTSGTGVLPYGGANLNGVPLLATGRGIYAIHSENKEVPAAQVLMYTSSLGQGVVPKAILTIGSQLLFAWENDGTYGVDKLDTNKSDAVIVTPQVEGSFSNVIVKYSSLPTGTSIAIRTKVDGGSWTSQTVITDTIRKICYFNGGLGMVNTLQAEITLNGYSSTSPEIEYIEFI
jgi:hypothetical protein